MKFYQNPSKCCLFIFKNTIWLISIIFSISLIIIIESASFYGQSYLKIPFYNQQYGANINETRIKFRFRTHQSNAFIFLAAGSSDYCLLYLNNGQLSVKINFGLGETFLQTNSDDYNTKPLNDLQWHDVHLERIDKKLFLKIDSKQLFSTNFNGLYNDNNNGLKIQYGIYVGSQSGLKSLYLADLPSFRGCIDQIEFNGQNLFNLINNEQQSAINHKVNFQNDCDEQFVNNYNKSVAIISFVQNENSYILLPCPLKNRIDHFSIKFELKTTSINAMIVFISGLNTYRKEYFAIEIINKRLKISINNGNNNNNELKLQSNIIISDSYWHRIEILFMIDNQFLLIIDDDQREQISISTVTTLQLQFSDQLFLGGLNVEHQSLAVNYGIESTLIESNVSLKGCIKNFQINNKLINIIHDALITNQIYLSDECRWKFLCHANNDDSNEKPCIDQAECIHEKFNRIDCKCNYNFHHHYHQHYHNHRHWKNSIHQTINNEQKSNNNNNLPSCVRNNFKHKSIVIESIDSSHNEYNLIDKILPNPLISCDDTMGEIVVSESTTTEINTDLLNILVNSKILSNNNTFDVVVAKKPDYGSINLDQMTIDMNLLRKKSIIYTHIISGKTKDSMSIELVDRQLSRDDHTKCDRYLVRIIFKIIQHQQQQQQQKNKSIHSIQLKILANRNFPLDSSIFKLKEMTKGKNSKKHFKIISIDDDQGYFAFNNQFDNRIENFFDNDIRNGNVFFVHKKNSSNLINYSSSSSIKCLIDYGEKQRFELIFKLFDLIDNDIINTGILIAHHTYALITSTNLSLQFNDTDIELKDKNFIAQILRYEIDKEPKSGQIQKLRSSMTNNWSNVTQFTQRQLDRGKIRYIHLLNDWPEYDQFTVNIMFQKQLIHQIEFLVKFVKNLEIESRGTNIYNFSRNEKEFIITNVELAYQTQPILSDIESIRYRLRSLPSYGILYSSASDLLQTKLNLNSQFSQKDLNERKIFYVRNNSFINIDSLRDLIDSFTYQVFIETQKNITKNSTFYIHFDSSLQNYVLINRKLTVLEGDRSLIDSNHLYLRSTDSSLWDKNNDIIFHIIKQPKFGRIELENDGKISLNPSKISQNLLQEKKVFYVHDDSENNIDFFDFSIENYTNNHNDNNKIKAKFSIEIMMKNDNAPKRKCFKRLNIIRNSERILTDQDICYVDLDLNTSPNNILFTKIYSTIGSFHWQNDSMAQTFTQQDINDGGIKFRHNGHIDIGKAMFSITDGHFNLLSESLEIFASEPFIEIKNNTGVIVKYGETCLITTNNLSIETNLPNKNEIFIKLLNEPHYGQLFVNEKTTNHFTLQELEDGFVEYESTSFDDDVTTTPMFSKNDSFEFRVFSNDRNYKDLVTKSQEFIIRIYPQNYFHLNIINIKNITMLEDSQVIIDDKTLLVKHYELKTNNIIYTIIKQPKSGVMKKLTKSNDGLIVREDVANSFSQQDINDGKIIYQNIQSSKQYNNNNNIIDQNDTNYNVNNLYLNDSFTVDIGDNTFTLINDPIIINIELIPKFITLKTTNLTVSEGNSATLTRTTINLTHPYYMKYVDEFIIIEEPKYGTISSITDIGHNVRLSIKSFTNQQLDSGRIYYQHDSSEYERDWFTIVARANSIEKESLPATIHIFITSINDEPPKIETIEEINGEFNEKIAITNQSLYALDADSKPNEIVYLVSMPINGYLINNDKNMTIDKFTQADIDDGRIYFVHVGTSNASFRFHLTDGKNYGSSNVFRIRIRNRHIMIDTNQKMFITPGSQQSITNRHLQVSSSDPEDNINQTEFIYRMIKTPTYGRIILEGGFRNEEEINNFTQKQINENLVLYDQNVAINEPIAIDRIIFNIESPNMPTINGVHFIIEIANENIYDLMKTRIDSLIPIESLNVVEGKFRPISLKELDFHEFIQRLQCDEDKVLLKIIRQPLHGIILRNGLILDNYALFPVTAIRNQSIVYMHDDSNTYTDDVAFAIYTNDNFLMSSFINLTLPIRIIPVNDEYPIVVNQNPRMIVNIGSKTLITRSILYTRDNDGNDTNIVYMLAADKNWNEKNGFFMRFNHSQETSVYSFTQQDINDNQIEFVHRGNEPIRLLYWFRVKDEIGIECSTIEPPLEYHRYTFQSSQTMNEEHCTPYYPFTINVVQFVVELLNKTDIHLYQASEQTSITNVNLAVKTDNLNINLNEIIYQIKSGPFYGHLLVNGSRNIIFNQQQINDGKVFYVQDTIFNREDSFTFDIIQQDNEKVLNNVELKIIIVPLVKALRPFVSAFPSQKSLINIEHIDASELATKTNSNPVFKIIEQPKYGSLNLLSFNNQNNGNIIDEFSQDDIVKNRIVYETFNNVEAIYSSNEVLTDRIIYELQAANVQTAKGVLVIKIFNNQSTNDELMNEILMKTNYITYIGMTMIKEQYLLLIFFILFILLLITVIWIICRMCFFRIKSKKLLTNMMNTESSLVSPTVAATTTPATTGSTTQTDHSSTITHSSASSSSYSRPNIDHSSISHYSSSTTFHDNSVLRTDEIADALTKQSTKNIIDTKLPLYHHDYDDAIHLQLLKCNGKKYDHDEMSPLPPPSLYFINDGVGKNQRWNQLNQINNNNNNNEDSGESHSEDDIVGDFIQSYSPPYPFDGKFDDQNTIDNSNNDNIGNPYWI